MSFALRLPFLARLRPALSHFGRARFAQQLDAQIDKQLGDKLPQELKDVVKPQGLLEALGGLLGGKKEEKWQRLLRVDRPMVYRRSYGQAVVFILSQGHCHLPFAAR